MSTIYYPVRGFFIGKANKYLQILLVITLLAFPAAIKADTAVPHTPTAPPTTTVAHAAAPSTANPAINILDTETAWVTAYTSDPDETSDHPLITASGGMVHDGVVADNSLPFGTQIEIPGLFGNKIFTVEDRTSQKFSGRVDIWMPTQGAAINFGIQHVKIVVLDSAL
jgi:3D (Asp-Asp-Asp) domain-containing protein